MKASRIKSLTDADKTALGMLARCGNANTATLKALDLSPTRIESLNRDRLIQSVDKDQKYQHKNDQAIWALTPKGKSLVKSALGIEHCCCGTNAVVHNSHVAETFCANINRDDLKVILNENETRAYVKSIIDGLQYDDERRNEYWDWNERFINREMSMPDLTIITTTGSIECYEVVTSNYGIAEIEAKELTAEFLEAVITMIHT